MSSFDEMLAKLHNNALLTDKEQCIEINNKRQFITPPDFDTTIAYEGDVNSQIVTFVCPVTHEGHDLSQCKYKKLLWVNKTSGAEGVSTLTNINSEDPTTQKLEWLVPPEVFTKAGTIELSISLYDLVGGRLAFAWNTPTFSQLQVGSTMQGVGVDTGNTNTPGRRAPARNEILTIDLDRRNIIAPSDYNYMVANVGEAGLATLHFQVPRYYKNLDVKKSIIKINVSFNNNVEYFQIDRNKIFDIYADGYIHSLSDNGNGDGLIQFDWDIPAKITQSYSGNFTIGITFSWNLDKQILKISQFGGLKIGGTVEEEPNEFKSGNSYHIQGERYNKDQVINIGGVVSIRENTPQIVEINANKTAVSEIKIDSESGESSTEITFDPSDFMIASNKSGYLIFKINRNDYAILKTLLKLEINRGSDNNQEFSLTCQKVDWDGTEFNSSSIPTAKDDSIEIRIDAQSSSVEIELELEEVEDKKILALVFNTIDENELTFVPSLIIQEEIKLKHNELVAEYQDNKCVGLKIGTGVATDNNLSGEQLFSEATYLFSNETVNNIIKNYLTNNTFTISAQNL